MRLRRTFPLTWEYLSENKKTLENRENGRFKETWWQFGRTQNLTEFDTTKLMTPDIANRCEFTFDSNNLYHTTTVYSLSFSENKHD
ncbi:hypothetical protein MASR1M107_11100 [Ignavibacteriales bacterium]